MDATKSFPPGPYTLGSTDPIIIEGVERVPEKPYRVDGGAFVIMAPTDDPETYGEDGKRPVGHVILQIGAKRGEHHRLPLDADPEQLALARLWMAAPDLLEAAIALRQHLALFCGPDDDIANGLFAASDAAIAKARSA